jgi:hypothetical protein
MNVDDMYCKLADLKEALETASGAEADNLRVKIAQLEDDIACEEQDQRLDNDEHRV